ncbi:hypothetical protein BS47DRAFT_1369408 [Hydnum rufescens UP504]|uniref:Uncharacterized protein n=1 Tax=Hydnum rufescens UP504 TaxID=1448309 RepID=A0A9P6ACY6_9AGAM|nr:hypothetical protein BS47DRAFT_1369408 [Hydnum rufescens UP504]
MEKPSFFLLMAVVFVTVLETWQICLFSSNQTIHVSPDCSLALHQYSGFESQNPGQGFWGCSKWGDNEHCKFFCMCGQATIVLSIRTNPIYILPHPKTPTHVSQITSTPLTPTHHPATQSLNLQLALNEAEREALESTLQNIELKQTVEALNCRIERIPDVAKQPLLSSCPWKYRCFRKFNLENVE